MKIEVKDYAGKAKGSKELDDFIFNSTVNKNVIYESLRNQLANKRQGTASSKTRGMVHGTTTKPWRQKGTGRARAGTTKSPLWRGGGVIFGPHARDFSYRVPRKVSRAAICSVLSMFVKEQKIQVMEDIKLDGYQTRKVVEILGSMTNKQRVVYITQAPPASERESYNYFRKSAANLPWLRIVSAESLEIKDLYYAKEIIISVTAIDTLNKLSEVWKKNKNERGDKFVSEEKTPAGKSMKTPDASASSKTAEVQA